MRVTETVDNFTYIGTELTQKKKEGELEIQKSIMPAYKIYFSKLPIIKSRLSQRKNRLRIHKTLIRPVVNYGCEAWTQPSGERLAISGRKRVRKIFGPVYENDLGWRLRHNKKTPRIIR